MSIADTGASDGTDRAWPARRPLGTRVCLLPLCAGGAPSNSPGGSTYAGSSLHRGRVGCRHGHTVVPVLTERGREMHTPAPPQRVEQRVLRRRQVASGPPSSRWSKHPCRRWTHRRRSTRAAGGWCAARPAWARLHGAERRMRCPPLPVRAGCGLTAHPAAAARSPGCSRQPAEPRSQGSHHLQATHTHTLTRGVAGVGDEDPSTNSPSSTEAMRRGMAAGGPSPYDVTWR